ncbi:unnamed protein product [Sphenostylis stenocarpa]|uniref:Uncharacterized protein n=1 Tax=Sphenostylis stenocarpa TaxID=92480 RepID=A0AA86W1Z1_9FABA|nr:unnamed protein product [Sphenostylis stenocarpa]
MSDCPSALSNVLSVKPCYKLGVLFPKLPLEDLNTKHLRRIQPSLVAFEQMASITAPNSLQIRLAFAHFNTTKLNPVLFHTRLPHVDRPRRVCLSCVANHGNGSDSASVRVGSDGLSDSEIKKNDSYGGVVGVAGIVLLSGIVFASFLVSRRNCARQVNPLATHQEVLLSSDDCNDKIEHANTDNKVEQGNIIVECRINIFGDCSSSESDKYTDATTYISIQKEVQHGSVVPSEGTVALNDPESENSIDSSDSYSFRDLDSSVFLDTEISITELKENSSFVEQGNISNFDAEPLPVISEQRDAITGSSGNESSAISNTSSFETDKESVLVNIAFSTQSNEKTSDPEVFPEEDDSSVSTNENLDLNNMLQVIDKSSLEEWNLSENEIYESPNSAPFYSTPGIPASSVVSAAVQMLPGKILVPAAVDQGQGQALTSLQALKDLVSWKMVLEKRQLPETDGKMLYQLSGFIDADKIHSVALPALVADVSTGAQGITALAFVTKAQAAVALATGDVFDLINEELARIEVESMADNAVVSHSALVAQVEKDINASSEQKFSVEREKINVVERMRQAERAAIESERNVFSKLKHEVEDHLQNLISDKVEIAYEKEKISKLRELTENEKKEITRLQYELEVERKALPIATACAVALERARDHWGRNGIKVVDDDFREDSAGEQFSVQEVVDRGDSLLDKLKKMAAGIERMGVCKTGKQAEELRETAISKVGKSVHKVQQRDLEFGFTIKEGAERNAGGCREGFEKLTQKLKT